MKWLRESPRDVRTRVYNLEVPYLTYLTKACGYKFTVLAAKYGVASAFVTELFRASTVAFDPVRS
jgi:hypothetical protein